MDSKYLHLICLNDLLHCERTVLWENIFGFVLSHKQEFSGSQWFSNQRWLNLKLQSWKVLWLWSFVFFFQNKRNKTDPEKVGGWGDWKSLTLFLSANSSTYDLGWKRKAIYNHTGVCLHPLYVNCEVVSTRLYLQGSRKQGTSSVLHYTHIFSFWLSADDLTEWNAATPDSHKEITALQRRKVLSNRNFVAAPNFFFLFLHAGSSDNSYNSSVFFAPGWSQSGDQ